MKLIVKHHLNENMDRILFTEEVFSIMGIIIYRTITNKLKNIT